MGAVAQIKEKDGGSAAGDTVNEHLLRNIWLGLACTPASDTFALLHKSFATTEEIYQADRETLRKTLGSKHRDLDALADKSLVPAQRILNYCQATSVNILAYDDAEYPQRLLDITNPPVLLYCKGSLPTLKQAPVIGMVGTRSMTAYGKRNAFRIACELAAAGVLIVSGMARGIDAVAAVGALHMGGKTVAILGSGIDVIYPPEHRTLYAQIAENGAVITEYPPGVRPERHHFPQRNRLISALSDGVFLVEGSGSSGALITAGLAQDCGKKVFALPGDTDRVTSEAPNLLIQRGAVAVTAADDIINAFEYPDKTKAFLQLLRRIRHGTVDHVLQSYGVWTREIAPTQTDDRAARARDAVPAYTRAAYVGAPDIESKPLLQANGGALFVKQPYESMSAQESVLTESDKATQEQPQAPCALLSALPAGDPAHRVYAALPQTGNMTANELAECLQDIPFGELSAALTTLELLGAVQNLPGGRYGRSEH